MGNQVVRVDFAGNEVWDNEVWKKALLELFEIKESYEGRADREQLVLYGQIMYNCMICQSYI